MDNEFEKRNMEWAKRKAEEAQSSDLELELLRADLRQTERKHGYSMMKEEQEQIYRELVLFLKRDYELAYNLLKAKDLEEQWQLLQAKNIPVEYEMFEELISLPAVQKTLQERAVFHDIMQDVFSDDEVFKKFLLLPGAEQTDFLSAKGYTVAEEVLADFTESMYWMFESSILREAEKINEKMFSDNDLRKKIVKSDGSIDLSCITEQFKGASIPLDEKALTADVEKLDEKMLPFMELLKKMEAEQDLKKEFEKLSENTTELLTFLKNKTGVDYTQQDMDSIYEVLQMMMAKQMESCLEVFFAKLASDQAFFGRIVANIDNTEKCLEIAKEYGVQLMTEMVDILRERLFEHTSKKMEQVMERMFADKNLMTELAEVAGKLSKQREILRKHGIVLSEEFCKELFDKIQQEVVEASMAAMKNMLEDKNIMNSMYDEQLSRDEKYEIAQNAGYDLAQDALNSLLDKIEMHQKREEIQNNVLEQLKYLILNSEQLKSDLYSLRGDIEGQWKVVKDCGIDIELDTYRKFVLGSVDGSNRAVGEFLQALDNDPEMYRKFFQYIGDFDKMWEVVCEYGFGDMNKDLFWDKLDEYLSMNEENQKK